MDDLVSFICQMQTDAVPQAIWCFEMNDTLNSLKGLYIGDYIGVSNGDLGGYSEFRLWLK